MMKLEGALYPWRFRVVVGLLVIMVGAIAWRIVDLQVVDRDFLKGQGDARSVRHIPIPAHRGLITDRNGEPLNRPSLLVGMPRFSVVTLVDGFAMIGLL